MEKVLVMLLTVLVFFLGFLILSPHSNPTGDRYSVEEKINLTRAFAHNLESDPEAPRWSRIDNSTSPTPSAPSVTSQVPKIQEHLQDTIRSRAKNLPLRPLGLPIERRPVPAPHQDPASLLQSIETTYQNERNVQTLKEVETLALETLHQILRQPESPLRTKAMKLLEIDLLPNASSPDRKVEMEALLNEARLTKPQAPQVDR
jgi:hypothetical protein